MATIAHPTHLPQLPRGRRPADPLIQVIATRQSKWLWRSPCPVDVPVAPALVTAVLQPSRPSPSSRRSFLLRSQGFATGGAIPTSHLSMAQRLDSTILQTRITL